MPFQRSAALSSNVAAWLPFEAPKLTSAIYKYELVLLGFASGASRTRCQRQARMRMHRAIASFERIAQGGNWCALSLSRLLLSRRSLASHEPVGPFLLLAGFANPRRGQ